MADVRHNVSVWLESDLSIRRRGADGLMVCINDRGMVMYFMSSHCTPSHFKDEATICTRTVQLLLLTGCLVLDWYLLTNLPCDPLQCPCWEDDRTLLEIMYFPVRT